MFQSNEAYGMTFNRINRIIQAKIWCDGFKSLFTSNSWTQHTRFQGRKHPWTALDWKMLPSQMVIFQIPPLISFGLGKCYHLSNFQWPKLFEDDISVIFVITKNLADGKLLVDGNILADGKPFSVGKHLIYTKHLASIKMLTDLTYLPDLTIDKKLDRVVYGYVLFCDMRAFMSVSYY